MSPEDRVLIHSIMDAMRAHEALGKRLSAELAKEIARSRVLTTVCGALYAEIAKVSGDANNLDVMLAKVFSLMETTPDSRGYVLAVADEVRGIAESLS